MTLLIMKLLIILKTDDYLELTLLIADFTYE
jgi:hypothetical protein